MQGKYILPPDFFIQEDTLSLARYLLGQLLYTQINQEVTAGRIVETEAYLGAFDRASHAYGMRRTVRTQPMYLPGGHAYVYLCYGLHHLFNVVTNRADVPHAILIRALEPMEGIAHMLRRKNQSTLSYSLTRGPGSLSKAMGIHTGQSGMQLVPPGIFIASDGYQPAATAIGTSPRIGVDYAGEDALLPYRFFIKNNPWVSGRQPKTSDT